MNTCETCIFWNRRYDINEDGMADCDFPDTLSSEKNLDSSMTIQATAADDHGLEAILMTGRNFGCVRHQTKFK